MLGDWIEFQAIGGRAEILLKMAPLRNVQAVPGGFRAKVSPRRFKQLSVAAEKKKLQLEVISRGGPDVLLTGYKKRYGLLLGLMVFLMLMRAFEQVNWTVKFIDLTENERAQIEEILWETGLNPGQIITREKLQKAEYCLMHRQNDFGWITLNQVGGKLVAERTRAETAGKLPESSPHDLIARVDARVSGIDIRGGFVQCAIGQTVAKGETLVAVSKLDHLNRVVFQPTQGEIIGEFTVQYRICQPLTIEYRAPGSGRKRWVRLMIGSKQFPCWGKKLPGRGVTRRNNLELYGFCLPASVVSTEYRESQRAKQLLTPEAAKEFARYQCLCSLKAEYPDAEILKEKINVAVTENALEYCWEGKICANIAVEGDSSSIISVNDG